MIKLIPLLPLFAEAKAGNTLALGDPDGCAKAPFTALQNALGDGGIDDLMESMKKEKNPVLFQYFLF
jgi:hypothetical protein